jgi:hypothetical protein
MMTFPAPEIIAPTPPQWVVISPIRTAGWSFTMTVPLPCKVNQIFGPQHAACTPLSTPDPLSWGAPATITSPDPVRAGPETQCGHPLQPCASAGLREMSVWRAAEGMVDPLNPMRLHTVTRWSTHPRSGHRFSGRIQTLYVVDIGLFCGLGRPRYTFRIGG